MKSVALTVLDPARAASARRIAAALGAPRGRVVVTCKTADAFVPALLGAWHAGATVELLPNVQPGTLDRVDADPDIALVLHDGAELRARSEKARYVPELLATIADDGAPARPMPEIAALMATSGTTERPRYVAKTMAQLTGELAVLAQIIPPARCVLSTVPLSHLYGMLWGVLLPLAQGTRIVSHDAFLPAELAAVIAREQVDLLISTPAHLRAMAAVAMPRELRVVSSGARLPAELHASLAAAHGWRLTEILGSTETGGIATRESPDAGFRPLPQVTVTCDDDARLVVESPWCERATLEDQIELVADGTFRHLGRTSELIKVAGKRAHAHELEAVLRGVPGITDAAVALHHAPGHEPRVVAAIVGTVDREQLADAIRRDFDAVFVPRIVKRVAKIPRSDRGKLELAALRSLLGLAGDTTTEIPLRRLAADRFVADIPEDLVFFRGHFDAFTLLPGAVLIERVVWPAVRQELPTAKLRGIRRLRFRQPVLPGQQLAIALDRRATGYGFEVARAGAPVATGQLLLGE
jgi:4-coumarate--CoA ligase (photoactive yellow protein activation family)